jgi:MFS superfamily sulfate permease-like transporter
LMNIAIWLIDIWLLKKLYNLEKQALYITLITTFFSVFWEPTYWILIWTVITLIIYIKKITNSDASISVFKKTWNPEKIFLWKYLKDQQKWDIILTKFSWWLNYLNIENHISKISKLNSNQKIIISLSHITNIDIDWIEAIDEMIETLENNKIDVYISWSSENWVNYVSKLHSFEKLNKSWKIFTSSTEALDMLKNKKN